MKTDSYYIIRLQPKGWMGYEYAERVVAGNGKIKWLPSDAVNSAEEFDTHGKAAKAAKKLKLCRQIVARGGRWEIVQISERVVEASDESPLLKLARCAV